MVGAIIAVLAAAPQPGRAQDLSALRAKMKAEVAQEVQRLLPDDGGPGWLGVTIAEVTLEKAKELKLPAERGVLIAEVQADSPAAKAGLKANDVVTEYNGQGVEGAAQFRRMVRETPAGRTAQLSIWRDARAQSISLTVGSYQGEMRTMMRNFAPKNFEFHFEMPEVGGNFLAMRTPLLGIGAQNLSGQLGEYFGAPEGEGVLVTEVRSGSAAEKAGVKAGDVIVKVNGERVRTINDLREKMREKRETKTVSLGVLRKGAELSLNVEVEAPKPPAERKKLISRRAVI